MEEQRREDSELRKAQPGSTPRSIHRAWSVYVGHVAGIPIFLHVTFVLLLGFVAMTEAISGQQILGGLLLVVALFASIVLHELGHALMARRFGIKTEDIVLYPIGGVARLRSMGEGFQEFWIAIAGPAVTFLIVLGLAAFLAVSGGFVPWESLRDEANPWLHMTFLQRLMYVNFVLLLFNLIPAFPMDGGRMLRAVLSIRLPKERATVIAARIGQTFAIVFMVGGFFVGQPFLMLIGLFVFVAAGQESSHVQSAAMLSGAKVHDAMITHFQTLTHGDSLGRAADLLLSTSQQDFPVYGGGEVIGVLSRKMLLEGLARNGRDHYVAEIMDREFKRVEPTVSLERAFQSMMENGGQPLLVFAGDHLVGYVNSDNLMEYILIKQARSRADR